MYLGSDVVLLDKINTHFGPNPTLFTQCRAPGLPRRRGQSFAKGLNQIGNNSVNQNQHQTRPPHNHTLGSKSQCVAPTQPAAIPGTAAGIINCAMLHTHSLATWLVLVAYFACALGRVESSASPHPTRARVRGSGSGRGSGSSLVGLVDIFTSGTSTNSWSRGKPVTYRIPCLVESKVKGVLLALASERLGGSGDESDTNLVQRRSTDGGSTWSNTTLVVSAEVDPPFAARRAFISSAPWAVADAATGDVLMFYNQNSTENEKCDCNVWYVRTSDGGVTWSKPVPIPRESGVVGSSLNTGITLATGPHKGRLVMCMRRICKNSCPGPWQSFVAFSDDHGSHWHASPFLEEGSTECQVTELSTGDVYMSIRPYKELQTRSRGRRASALSTDGGTTFGPIKFEPQLVNAGGVDGSVVTHFTGGMPSQTIFFSHPDAGGRENMTLYTSLDDARTWETTLNVYKGGSEYSSMAMLPPLGAGEAEAAEAAACRVGLAFEKDSYQSIAFATIVTPC